MPRCDGHASVLVGSAPVSWLVLSQRKHYSETAAGGGMRPGSSRPLAGLTGSLDPEGAKRGRVPDSCYNSAGWTRLGSRNRSLRAAESERRSLSLRLDSARGSASESELESEGQPPHPGVGDSLSRRRS
jgi:hypothetical protein